MAAAVVDSMAAVAAASMGGGGFHAMGGGGLRMGGGGLRAGGSGFHANAFRSGNFGALRAGSVHGYAGRNFGAGAFSHQAMPRGAYSGSVPGRGFVGEMPACARSAIRTRNLARTALLSAEPPASAQARP